MTLHQYLANARQFNRHMGNGDDRGTQLHCNVRLRQSGLSVIPKQKLEVDYETKRF